MYTRIPRAILATVMLVLCGSFIVVSTKATVRVPVKVAETRIMPADSPADKSYQHLVEVADRYHEVFFAVYEDVGSAGNHFVHRAKMGADVTLDDAYAGIVHSGATAISNTFTARGSNWGGWYFQNGVLLGEDVAPSDNWGVYEDAGYDLSGATQLTFWARGEVGGERVEFFAFGVGYSGQAAISPYPDSSPKVTTCGRLVSPCYITLSNAWQQYTINLSGVDLHYVLGGFGWVTNAPQNSNRSITFYLDDIRYDKPRSDDLRLLVSYQTIPSAEAFDLQQRNVAYVYDNALALTAFLAAGDQRRATLLADALVYAQDHDRWYEDGRLRDGYQGGDLISPPGWAPHGRVGTARMCGWWDADKRWHENVECVSSHTGNLAWTMIALLNYYEKFGGDKYLNAAIRLGDWIETNTYDTRGAGGYTGGYAGWEPNPQKERWKATEHNLDLQVAFSRLHTLTGQVVWQSRAQHARDFVEAMWEPGNPGHYWTGTLDDGVTINTQTVPLDAQAWSLLAFGPNDRTRQAIAYAEAHHRASWGSYEGFDFNDDRDMPWPEGTSQMVVAYRMLVDPTNVQYFLAQLRAIQATATHNNGKGIVAAPADGLTTGFGWEYFNRLHVGATAWFFAGERAYNPYCLSCCLVCGPRRVYLPLVIRGSDGPPPTATSTPTATQTATPTPTATPTASPTASATLPLPDLSIVSAYVNMRGFQGGCVSSYDVLMIAACIRNQGSEDAGPFWVALSGANAARFIGLRAGETKCTELSEWRYGFDPVIIVVDGDNEVAESDEDNNVWQGILPIPTPPAICTSTATSTATATATPTVTSTPTPTDTVTPTATATPSQTPTSTSTPTLTPPLTPTTTPTPTFTPTPCLSPALEFTFVPLYGSTQNLVGRVYCVNPVDYKVVVYIWVSGWWVKPFDYAPLTTIRSAGTWTCDITTGGNDPIAGKIAAFLIPDGYSPPILLGASNLPQELYDHAITYKIIDRPPSRTISFAGQTWYVKAADWAADPGPCYYSDRPEDVWVDAEGRLHLKIAYHNGRWYCSEVFTTQQYGYGTYVYKLASPVDQLDKNAVLGLFTWDDTSPAYSHREIDIEMSRWGAASDPNAQYVVSPWNNAGHRYRFNLALPEVQTVHAFTWSTDSVAFGSYRGNLWPAEPGAELQSWTYTGSDVPPAGQGNARINLWLFNRAVPSDGQEIEVIVTGFSFIPG